MGGKESGKVTIGESNGIIKAVADLQLNIGGRIDGLTEKVADLAVKTGETAVNVKNQGREIGELKTSQNELRMKVDSFPTSIIDVVKEHKLDCQKERDRLEDITMPIDVSPNTRNQTDPRPSAFIRGMRPLIKYVIAAIIAALLGGGITIAFTESGPVIKTKPGKIPDDEPSTAEVGEKIKENNDDDHKEE